MLSSAARKKSPRSPSPRRITRASAAAARASPPSSPKATKPASTRATKPASTRATKPASTRATKANTVRAASPPKKDTTDPYATPFWPPSNYSVPAKFVMDRESPTPLPRTLAKHKEFIVELKKVLINEKVIDRDSPQFKGLLAEQQKFNMRFFRLKPYNIICFVKCEYELYDKMAPRVFHKGNKEPYYGNLKFVSLLRKNNMDMKWFGDNMLYIHKNRF
jgi:hypothetical protein